MSSVKSVSPADIGPELKPEKVSKLRIDYNAFRKVMDSIPEGETGRQLLVYSNLMPCLKLDKRKEQLKSFSAKYVWGFLNKWEGLLLKEFSTEDKAKDFVKKLDGTTIRKAVEGKKVYMWYCLLKKLESEDNFVILTYVKQDKKKEVKELLKDLTEGVDYKIVSRLRKGVKEEIKKEIEKLKKEGEEVNKKMIRDLKIRSWECERIEKEELLLFRVMEDKELKKLIKP